MQTYMHAYSTPPPLPADSGDGKFFFRIFFFGIYFQKKRKKGKFVCIHAYMHTCGHADMQTCRHAGMQTYIHTCIHTAPHPHYQQVVGWDEVKT